MEEDIDRYGFMEGEDSDNVDDNEEVNGEDSNHDEIDGASDEGIKELVFYPEIPVVLPRSRFTGACNVETVKDGQCSILV